MSLYFGHVMIITGYLAKYTAKLILVHYKINPFQGLDKINYSFVFYAIRNPPTRTALDFKSAQFDPVFGFASDWIKLRGLEI